MRGPPYPYNQFRVDGHGDLDVARRVGQRVNEVQVVGEIDERPARLQVRGQRCWEITEVDRRVRVSPLHRPAQVRGAIARRRPRPTTDHVTDDDRVLMGRDYDVAFRHLRDEGDDLVLLVLAGLVLEVRVGVLDERAEFTGLDVSGRFVELRSGDTDEGPALTRPVVDERK